MKYNLLIVIVLFFSCSKGIDNLYEGDFYTIVTIADSLDKNIWMILGGGKNCDPCNRIIREMKERNLFEKYKNDFIFYKCNANDCKNTFLQYLFLITEVPNSYIIDRRRNIVSFLQTDLKAKHIEIQLK